ncbi:GDP-mannose pyrophosphatase [Rhodobacteraceae bacterium CCMM004]|nr:GDP-mannose pyrophosphatase [Rhodobacteraceae bacterium CCMM004]
MSVGHRIRIRARAVLSEGFSRLTRTHLDWRTESGAWIPLERECLERKDGCVFLPYDPDRRRVMLVRQFRWPAYVAGRDELLLEAAAGYLDGADPETRCRAEAQEELGLTLGAVRPVYDLLMLPGTVAARQVFLVATYDAAAPRGPGGGLPHEGEEVAPVEMEFEEALAAVADGRIVCAKTVILLQYAALHLFPGGAAG